MSLSLAAVVLAELPWKKVFEKLTAEAAARGAKSLLGRLKPGEQEAAAEHTLELFVHEFVRELEDKTPLSAALPGYKDQLKRLIELAAPDIAGCLHPDAKEVDLEPVRRQWTGDPLPEDFDWGRVRRGTCPSHPHLHKTDSRAPRAVVGRTAGATNRASGQIPTVASSNSGAGSRVRLGRIPRVPPQKVRRAATLGDAYQHLRSPHQSMEHFRSSVCPRVGAGAGCSPRAHAPNASGKHLTAEPDQGETERLREIHRTSSIVPALEVIARERLVVVLGDPGSGKTSLLKFLVMRWMEAELDAPDKPDAE